MQSKLRRRAQLERTVASSRASFGMFVAGFAKQKIPLAFESWRRTRCLSLPVANGTNVTARSGLESAGFLALGFCAGFERNDWRELYVCSYTHTAAIARRESTLGRCLHMVFLTAILGGD
jgi:hypothetical protein